MPRFETAVGEIEAALTGANDLVDGLALRVDAGDETVAGQSCDRQGHVATRAGPSAWSSRPWRLGPGTTP